MVTLVESVIFVPPDAAVYHPVKEYVEFFKREIEALERRAKAADEARVETEARLARIAAALRG